MNINRDSKIELHTICSREENAKFIVWNVLNSKFIELPKESLETIQLLQKGLTIAQVSKFLEKKYGEPFDVSDFVFELLELGFVKSVDGIHVSDNTKKKVALSFIKKKHVTWLYSKPLMFLYLLLIITATVIFLNNPVFLPTYQDYFFTENYLLVVIFSLVSVFGLVFLHEFAHLIAGKTVGVEGSFSLGWRLFVPVAETNLSGLWSLPKKDRYLPFMAGMLNDCLIISVIVIFFFLSNIGLIPVFFPYSLCQFIVFILVIGLLWQFLFFVRTDIYFVISVMLGTRNLYGDSWQYIKNKISAFLCRSIKPLELPAKEYKAVRVYAWFMLAGTVFSIFFFIYFGFPILLDILQASFIQMSSHTLEEAIEGAILFVMVGLQIAGIGYFFAKPIRRIICSRIKTHN